MEAKLKQKISLAIGIVAMFLLVAGTVSEGGSQPQKILFVIGAPALGITAFINKQKMFTALQSVATIGTILAFFPSLPEEAKYIILLGAGIIGILYLFKSGYYKKDRFGWLGSIGLLSIAAGFATNAALNPLLFSFFLAFGGIIVAIYSALDFVYYKVRIAIIWVILNIIFAANPLLNLLSTL